LSVAVRRSRFVPAIEILTFAVLIAIAALSYFVVARNGEPDKLLSPPTIAALLVANLVPATLLMVLVARRIAMRRAARSEAGGRGRLHVRLVALFSAIASVPTIMVVIFASLLLQNGMEFWFSNRAHAVLTNAENAARIYEQEHKTNLARELRAMGSDTVGVINQYGLEEKATGQFLFEQTLVRELNEVAIITLNSRNETQLWGGINLYNRPLAKSFTPAELRTMKAGQVMTVIRTNDRVEGVIRLDPTAPVYLYASRSVNAAAITSLDEARSASSDYQKVLDRARTLQFRFNIALLLVSLLIVGIAIWVALRIADRLVRPVGELVDAARKVTAGDLSARVPAWPVKDEVATLGNAFNRMTSRLEQQTGALVAANAQLDSRRAFIEAVLSGVTAGVISVDQDRNVRLINDPAEALLGAAKDKAVGRKLVDLAPELDAHLDSDEREGIVMLGAGTEARTLAVKRVKVESGYVLTFDDITDQLLDQRRAAWSDVARRIAHEIKNPLTPIQLAAERLQRRYGKEIQSDPATFEQLTGTIVRQVGDLRRMVDEFSSFARMPKPVFRPEAIAEVARHALFLHEVAHPDIAFRIDAPDPSPVLVCDRRQLGQALTNIVKNGVEAIQQKREEGRPGADGEVAISISEEEEGRLTIAIRDSGIGLPPERARLTEPYMTTRTKGTGLGLAIVKKIVEEHSGSIAFEDAPGGGTLVRLVFDSESLSRLADGAAEARESVESL
jgi:two-component system nitrogen regulation sensor histidine kinase NtrY